VKCSTCRGKVLEGRWGRMRKAKFSVHLVEQERKCHGGIGKES